MVASQRVLDSLKQIGLNLYERKLWVALLSRGVSTAGELSSLAKVPHSRTYDVLESLADKGFVMIQSSKPLKYVAIAPEEALERAKNKIKKDVNVSLVRIDNLKKSPVLKELQSIHKHGVKLVIPGDLTASLKGQDAFNSQLGSLLKSAKNSILILTTPQWLNNLTENHKKTLKKASKKGVKIKIAVPKTKDSAESLNMLKKIAEIKRINKGDAVGRICIVDGSHVVMALTDENVHPSQDLAFWTQSEHVAADVLAPMFNSMWKKLSSV